MEAAVGIIMTTEIFNKEYIMRVLEHLEPKRVFYYFEELSKIPHGSQNTKKISDWIVDFAKQNNLKYIQDEYNNVIIIKQASKGYENADAIILQGHIDMVCEKDEGCKKDMEKEGLDLLTDGDFISAEGTTLGADNGIAVAMMMAVLESEELNHTRIEAVFTVDEEIGMLGADKIDLSMLSGKKLINIDSEDEGVFTVSCAGGNLTKTRIPVTREDFNGKTFLLRISGLKGGHSGIEIDKGRANASILMGRVLYEISQKCELRIISVTGGVKDNVITSEAESIVCVSSEDAVKNLKMNFSDEYRSTDPEIKIEVTEIEYSVPLDCESTKNVVRMLTLIPNGVIEMSADIPGLVQTSLNLGIVKTTDTDFITGSCVRSSKESQKDMLSNRIAILSETLGGKAEISGDYAGWDYLENSDLRRLMVKVFLEQYGYEPKIEAIHAGLECGVLASKIPGLDCISIGPNLLEIHTPRERMSASSVARVWKMITETLTRMI